MRVTVTIDKIPKTYIPVNEKHGIENTGILSLQMNVAQSVSYLGEDGISLHLHEVIYGR